jgi:deoxyadenosine/deoxycytidine kinase
MYIVEGNIGAGKSTFLKLVQTYLPHITVVFEPVHTWQNTTGDQSILANFYSDPHRWAYTMETQTLISRVQEHLKEQVHSNPFRLMERSIYSGHYCFATNSYRNGFLNELEWKLYLEWFNFLVTEKCKIPHGFIYLRTNPEVAYERIKKRNRYAENSINFEYIKQIHECHENFLVEKINILQELTEVPTLILDCNEEFELDKAYFMAHAQKMVTFMRAHMHTSRYHGASTLQFS